MPKSPASVSIVKIYDFCSPDLVLPTSVGKKVAETLPCQHEWTSIMFNDACDALFAEAWKVSFVDLF